MVLNGTGIVLDSRTVASSPDKKVVTSVTHDEMARTARIGGGWKVKSDWQILGVLGGSFQICGINLF
jgi:hypothetical protein